ncbi:MAG: hypothetical protein A3D92_17570 [Bacteroidetes bacterium RIFCSPHIGHO2_02_FULL_44_7]|nr:MAG: hypothetical protein A3D92_17570 [Bacteroidetes bacterium RIFCSPHIGHO2_02_FULL_44_7]
MTVLMSNPNFLILDEPTNDLDIFVMSVLEDYLRSFQGCLIVVSHDRYFMDKMVDHLFVFVGEGEIKDILGNYTVYRKTMQEAGREAKREENVPKVEAKSAPPVTEKRKLSFKEKSEFENLEKDLASLEEEKITLTEGLSTQNVSAEFLIQTGERLAVVVAELEEKTDRWLELSEFA